MLLFNWVGYRLYSIYQEECADARMEAAFDQHQYDEARLISLKIPVSHLGYYNSSVAFERVDGKVEIKGVLYKFVKRRLFEDSIEFLCIPNHAAMQMNNARDDYFKLVNDIPSNAHNKKEASHKNSLKNFSPDNYIVSNVDLIHYPGVTDISKSSDRAEELPSFFSLTDEQPPDTNS